MDARKIKNIILFIILLQSLSVSYALKFDFFENKNKLNASLKIFTEKFSVDKATINKDRVVIETVEQFSEADLKSLNKAAKNWISEIQEGRFAIVLNFEKNVRAKLFQSNKFILLELHKNIQKKSNLEERLLKARIAAAQGNREKSIEMLNGVDILVRNEDQINQVVTARAYIEYQFGLYQRVKRDLEHKKFKFDDYLYSELNNLLLPFNRPSIDLNFSYTEVKNSYSNYVSVLKYNHPIKERHYVGFDFSDNYSNIKEITDVKTGIISPIDDNYIKSNVFYKYAFLSGNYLNLDLFFNQKFIGIGTKFYLWDHKGGTLFELMYHHPNWSFNQSLVFFGTEDSLKIKRSFVFNNRLFFELKAELNNYNLQGATNIAQAFVANSYTQYTFDKLHFISRIFGADTDINLSHSLYALYPIGQREKTNSNGGKFIPLELSKIQAHTFSAGLAKNWHDKFLLNSNLGYAFDIYGEHGLAYNSLVAYKFNDKFKISGYYSMSLSSNNGSGNLQTIGANILWIF